MLFRMIGLSSVGLIPKIIHLYNHKAPLADEAASCHVEKAWAWQFTVKTLFVSWVLGLDLHHCLYQFPLVTHFQVKLV